MRSILFAFVCAQGMALTAASLQAEDFFWKSPVSGDFDEAGNWQPAGVPDADDTAVFNLGSSGYTVNFGLQTVQRLQINEDTLTLQGGILIATDTVAPAIQFGSNAGDVSLVTVNTSLFGTQILIGAPQNSDATVNLNGNLSTQTPFIFPPPPPGDIVIGAAGRGVLSANSGTVDGNGNVILGRDASGQGQLDLNGGHLTALGTGLVVGMAGEGYLNVRAGSADVNGELVIGRDQGSHGEIHVSGSNSDLSSPRYGGYRMTSTTIGSAGNGALAATDGAELQLEGPIVLGRDATGDGMLSVDGVGTFLDAYNRIPPSPAGSPGIAVGMSGKGRLSIIGGAGARLSGPIVVGQNVGSSGEVAIDGADTIVSRYGAGGAGALSLVVGKAGDGEVTISGGADAEFEGPIVLGEQATGDGKLDVKGLDTLLSFRRSNSEQLDQVIVGATGKGAMTVSENAVASFRDAKLKIAPNAGASGAVTITDPHSQLMTDQVDVGGLGTGTLSVLNQGELWVLDSTTGEGIIDVHLGSTFNVVTGRVAASTNRDVTVNNSGTFNNTSGLILGDVNNDGSFNNSGAVSGDVLNESGGIITGTGSIAGKLTQTGGTLSPGNSPGTLDVGSLDIEAGTLVIEMNSASGEAGGPIGWDLIQSQGMVSVTGPLTVELVSLSLDNQPGDVVDFNPERSKSWTIIRGGTGGSSIFDPNLLTLDTSGFTNDFAGRFSLSVLGANVALTYMRPVPEPGTLALAGLGVMALLVARRRLCRDNAPSAMLPG